MTAGGSLAAGSSLRGIACMLVSGIFLTANDSITKWLVPHYPAGEILCIQGTLIALLVAAWMLMRGEHPLRIVRWRSHLYRGGMYALGSFAFVYALRYLPLAEVIAIAFAGPLFMTLFGKLFLGEHVGLHRLGAVVVGFIGILVVMRPGTEAMHWAVVLPLVVALSDAFRDLITRTLTRDESSRRIIFTTAVILALAGGATAFGGWREIRQADMLWFGLSATCFVIAHYFMVEAFRHAQVVVVAPFRYFLIIWATLSGFLFWGEVPDFFVFVGVAIVVAAGIYIGLREARVGRQTRVPLGH
ncbi:MAG: DMT family transporter [Rhodobacter sp.]|nr:DMT family transporter [Rhodobacter sp.]